LKWPTKQPAAAGQHPGRNYAPLGQRAGFA